MLINALFLSFRELLPVFYLIGVCLLLLPEVRSRRWLLGLGVALGLLLAGLCVASLDGLGALFSGAGIEWLFSTCALIQVLAYIRFLWLAARDDSMRQRLIALVVLVALGGMTGFTDLLVLTDAYSQQQQQNEFAIGLSIGLSMAASVAVLLYFLLAWVSTYCSLLPVWAAAVFLAGHLAQTSNLLAQIGALDSLPVWSTRAWMGEDSAVAYLLYAIVGYDATPTLWQLVIYVSTLLILTTLIVRKRGMLRVSV